MGASTSETESLGVEDTKLVTLARATRARVGASQGAAVRDTDGRTYAAASVELDALRLTALQVAVGMAYSSGSRGLEAAVLLGADRLDAGDRALLAEFASPDVVVHLGDARGTVTASGTAADLTD